MPKIECRVLVGWKSALKALNDLKSAAIKLYCKTRVMALIGS